MKKIFINKKNRKSKRYGSCIEYPLLIIDLNGNLKLEVSKGTEIYDYFGALYSYSDAYRNKTCRKKHYIIDKKTYNKYKKAGGLFDIETWKNEK